MAVVCCVFFSHAFKVEFQLLCPLQEARNLYVFNKPIDWYVVWYMCCLVALVWLFSLSYSAVIASAALRWLGASFCGGKEFITVWKIPALHSSGFTDRWRLESFCLFEFHIKCHTCSCACVWVCMWFHRVSSWWQEMLHRHGAKSISVPLGAYGALSEKLAGCLYSCHLSHLMLQILPVGFLEC